MLTTHLWAASFLSWQVGDTINLTAFSLAIVLIGIGLANIGLVILMLIVVIELGALFRAQTIVQAWNNRIYRRRLAQLGVAT